MGAKVVVGDLKMSEAGKKLLDGYSNVVFQETDAMKWDQLQRLVTVAKEKFGETPSVYIGGAGVFEPPVRSALVYSLMILTGCRNCRAFGMILSRMIDIVSSWLLQSLVRLTESSQEPSRSI